VSVCVKVVFLFPSNSLCVYCKLRIIMVSVSVCMSVYASVSMYMCLCPFMRLRLRLRLRPHLFPYVVCARLCHQEGERGREREREYMCV